MNPLQKEFSLNRSASKKRSSIFSFAVIAWLFTCIATAQPTLFPTTGSWYDVVLVENTWTEANSAAAATSHLGMPGRLATITSQEENSFIFQSVLPVEYYGFWLGARQIGDSEPTGGWEWITGESWTFTNWANAEPNDAAPNEDFLQMYSAWDRSSAGAEIAGDVERYAGR